MAVWPVTVAQATDVRDTQAKVFGMLRDPASRHSTQSPSSVKKRCVFYIIGYEPSPPARIYRRFERELNNFRHTWTATAELSSPITGPDGGVTWRIDSAGPNWRVETDVVLLDWIDLVADFSQVSLRQIALGFAALFDFLWSGGAVRYLQTNSRYILFFAYAPLLLVLFAIAGFIIARFALPSAVPWRSFFAPLLGIVCVALLIRWAGRRLFLNYALLDWSFAADIVHRRRPELETKLDQLARAFSERVRTSAADEIVVFGHSLGAVIMMEVVARALRQDPQFIRNAAGINLVSAGSSLLKIGLHPAAEQFRHAVATVVAEPAIFWVEYQAVVDIFNFYKTDPVVEMGLPACGKPVVRIVRLRDMVTDWTYRRMRLNPLRLHRQFTAGNERRYFYDFFMICCGPLPLQYRVAGSPDQVVAAIASDGTYLEAAQIGVDTGSAVATNTKIH
jgi:pimeloyl-ACP methyl ester carboxylesterase